MVRVFDGDGKHKMDIGQRGTGPGEFNLPRDLAIGKDGKLYVVDGGNFRVVVFDRNGKYLNAFGSVGRQLGQFSRPKEIATDPQGNVYVVDAAFGNFQIFNEDGELLLFVGTRDERDGPARYMLPSGITVDEDGRVYMVDQWFRKIDVFRPYAQKADRRLPRQASHGRAQVEFPEIGIGTFPFAGTWFSHSQDARFPSVGNEAGRLPENGRFSHFWNWHAFRLGQSQRTEGIAARIQRPGGGRGENQQTTMDRECAGVCDGFAGFRRCARAGHGHIR